MRDAPRSTSLAGNRRIEEGELRKAAEQSHGAGQIGARGRFLDFRYDLATGRWSLRRIAGEPRWRCDGTGRVRLIDPEGEVQERDVASAALDWCREEPRDQGRARCFQIQRCWPDGLTVSQRFIVRLDALAIEAELSIRTPRNYRLALQSLVPLAPPNPSSPNVSLDEPPERSHTFRLLDVGWSTREPATVSALAPGAAMTATGLAVLGDEDGHVALTLGFLEAARAVGEYRATGFDRQSVGLQASAEFGQVDLPPSGATSGPLWLSAAPVEDSLPEFAAAWQARHRGRARSAALVQWQPFDSAGPEQCESEILARLASAIDWVGATALDVATVGPGWANVPGDWEPDPVRFPHGLRALRDAIHSQDLRAGICLTPLLVARSSSTFQAHPSSVVRSPEGDPVVVDESASDVFALDLTQPVVVDWLRALGRLVHETWGFDLVQADRLAQSVVSGWRANGRMSAIEAYWTALNALRGTMNRGLLIAADAPLFASLDVADGVLSGAEVVRRADPSPLLRAFLGGTGASIGPGPTSVGLEGQTIDEARAAATIACFGGGLVTLADDLGALPSDRTEILRACLPPYYERPLVPIAPFAAAGPSLFCCRVGEPSDDYVLLVVLNPADVTVACVVPLALLGLANERYHAFEFWTQTYLGALADRVALEQIPAGGCAVVGLRPARNEPQVVGTSLHVTLGAVALQSATFDRGDCRLHLVVGATGERHGTITVALPVGWKPGTVRGTGGTFNVRHTEETLAEVDLRFKDVAELELEFWPRNGQA